MARLLRGAVRYSDRQYLFCEQEIAEQVRALEGLGRDRLVAALHPVGRVTIMSATSEWNARQKGFTLNIRMEFFQGAMQLNYELTEL